MSKDNDEDLSIFKEDVEELLQKYVGGTKFFSELDTMIRAGLQNKYRNLLEEYIRSLITKYDIDVILVDGAFGHAFTQWYYKYWSQTDKHKGAVVYHTDEIKKFKSQETYRILFIDDSLYSGKTLFKTKKPCENIGMIMHTLVFYDGSNPLSNVENVTSFYRYYDYHVYELSDKPYVQYVQVSAKATNEHPDKVDHPAHYNTGKFEVIDVIEDWKLDFHLGNVVKYVARAGKKDTTTAKEDLEKAMWYLKRALSRIG